MDSYCVWLGNGSCNSSIYLWRNIKSDFNPAVTLGLAVIGNFAWASVPGYIAAQMLGAIVGACLVYIHYKKHFDATEDKEYKRGSFLDSTSNKKYIYNFVSNL